MFFTNNSLFDMPQFVKLCESSKKRGKFLILLAFPTILTFNFFMMASENSFAHWSMMGWMLLIPIFNSLNLFKSFKKKNFDHKSHKYFLFFSLILMISIHAKTGFLTKSYLKQTPEWDTRS